MGLNSFLVHSIRKKIDGTGSFICKQGLFGRDVVRMDLCDEREQTSDRT